MSSPRQQMAKTFLVRPGGCLVVEGACLQAAVQDADEPVRQPPQRVVVFDSTGAEVVVKGAGARDAPRAAKACAVRRR